MNFYGIDRLPFIGPDEPRYAQIAMEMYQSGDWISPRLAGIFWYEKPSLTYWVSGLGYLVFGPSEFAARFGVALIASLCVLLLYFFGKRIRSARLGYLSASVLVTSGLWLGFARGATFDMPLAVAIELALISFFLWESREKSSDGSDQAAIGKRTIAYYFLNNGWWWIFWFALGLATLAKGLVGIVLPLAVIVPYLLLTKRVKVLINPPLLLGGILIFIATAGIWYGPMFARHGSDFIDEFFIGHHFRRFVSNHYRHPQPFYFFFFVAIAGCFPWSSFLVSGGWQAIKQLRSLDRLRIFLWLWVLGPVLFFSFSGSKLPGYILPVFPAIALLIGLEIEQWWAEQEPKRMKYLAPATGLLIFVVALGFALRGEYELGLSLLDAFKVATIAIVVAVVYLALWFLLSGRAATLFLPFGLALIIIATVSLVFPALERNESLREFSLLAKGAAHSGERLVFFLNHDQGINFYATELPLRDSRSELITINDLVDLESLIWNSGGPGFLVASQGYWTGALKDSPRLSFEWLGAQKRYPRCSPGCDWNLYRVILKETGVRSQESRDRRQANRSHEGQRTK
jgi:4-amino-4-deoxy-L-arabinose transferase-like glycosyltransferase